jgi:hypothetical protein
MIAHNSPLVTRRVRVWLTLAAVLAVFLFALPQGHAQTGGAVRSTTTGTLKSEPPRNVRDHRGPGAVRGGGVKVSVKCNKKTHPRCHSH